MNNSVNGCPETGEAERPLFGALLFHIYLKNNWKTVTKRLLSDVPHQKVFFHVCFDVSACWKLPLALIWLCKRYPDSSISIARNSRHLGEVPGFRKLLFRSKPGNFDFITYMHTKGVTKPKNKFVQDWVELMRYYLIDRMDLCIDAFKKGYVLYGVNHYRRPENHPGTGPFAISDHHYSGNFVSLNLQAVRETIYTLPVLDSYFGVEGFWGQLCDPGKAFCAHNSKVDHYHAAYPAFRYRPIR